MMLLLQSIIILFLFDSNSIAAAMSINFERINIDMPHNFKELMPVEIINTAKLASEEKFDEGIEVLKEVFKNSEYFNPEKVYADLKNGYLLSKTEFAMQQDQLDSEITEKDFIFNNFLRHFWWHYYYPVYEIDD